MFQQFVVDLSDTRIIVLCRNRVKTHLYLLAICFFNYSVYNFNLITFIFVLQKFHNAKLRRIPQVRQKDTYKKNSINALEIV